VPSGFFACATFAADFGPVPVGPSAVAGLRLLAFFFAAGFFFWVAFFLPAAFFF